MARLPLFCALKSDLIIGCFDTLIFASSSDARRMTLPTDPVNTEKLGEFVDTHTAYSRPGRRYTGVLNGKFVLSDDPSVMRLVSVMLLE
jgi:hypothetical protein